MPTGRAGTSAGCASWPRSTACASSPWGRARTTGWPPRKAPHTSAWALCSGISADRADSPVTIRDAMGFADLWSRTLVYFGIAEEDEYWDEDGYVTNEELERNYAERPNVRRLPRRSRQEYEEWSDSSETAVAQRPAAVEDYAPSARQQAAQRPRRLETVPSPNIRV